MGIHTRIVGWVYLLWGLVILAIGVGALLLYGGVGVAALSDGEVGPSIAFGGLAVGIGGLLFALSIPNVLAGGGILLRLPWARPMGIGLAIVHLVIAPIGTLFGGYALYALMSGD